MIKTKQHWSLWIVLLLLAACLYLPFRSCSLDDFDAYSFALALENFDLGLQQPQPPGFPVYIFMARVVYALTGDAVSALTWVSALCGVGVVLMLGALGENCSRPVVGHQDTSKRVMLIAPLLLMALPMLWLTAGKPLSDVPGLFFTLLALWLLVAADARPWWLVAGGGVTGLALGVRPQNALPLILCFAWMGLQTLQGQRPWRHVGLIGAGGTVGVLLWLLPTAHMVGGLDAYMGYIRGHATHVQTADSLLGMAVPLGTALHSRAFAFGDTFLLYTIGVGTFNPWATADFVRVGILALVILVGLMQADWRRTRTWALSVWLLASTAFVFLFVTLDRPRLMLPMLPPLALLVAQGWARVKHPRGMLTVLLASMMLALLVQGVPLAVQLTQTPAPPAQAADYVAAHFPPTQTLVAAAGSFRAVQVDLAHYRVAFLYEFLPQTVADALTDGVQYVVVFDRDQFPLEVMDVLSAEGTFVPLDELTFGRDRRVHTQHDQVRVQVLTPSQLVPPSALRLPETGCLDIGGERDGRYLGTGWFRPEDVGGTSARWAGGLATATLRMTLPSASAYRVRMRVLAYPAEQQVQLRLNGHRTDWLNISQGWTELEVQIPGDWLTPDTITPLTLLHAHTLSPQAATDGGSSDTRALTVAYDWVCVEAGD